MEWWTPTLKIVLNSLFMGGKMLWVFNETKKMLYEKEPPKNLTRHYNIIYSQL